MTARVTQGGLTLHNYPVNGDQKRRDQERWAVPYDAQPVRGQLWERVLDRSTGAGE